jgi:hypothetical protein
LHLRNVRNIAAPLALFPSSHKPLKGEGNMTLKTTLLAAASLVLSAGAASAAPATAESAVNMRAGPGPQYEVVTTIPGGATVDVAGCTGSWCQVSFAGESGFANRSYLSVAEGGPAVAPGYAYDDTPLYSDDYYDDGYDYGSGFGVFVGPRHQRFHRGWNGNRNGGRVGTWQGNRGWSGNRAGTVQGGTTTQGTIGGRASVSAPVGLSTGSPGVFRGGAGAFRGGGGAPAGGTHMGGGAIGGGHGGGQAGRH